MKFALVLVILSVAVTASSAQQFAQFGYNRYFGAYPAGYGFAAPYFAAPYFAAQPDAKFFPAAPFAGNYVAANRGSVHVAPLDGHAQSVRSFNTDPAPGTFE